MSWEQTIRTGNYASDQQALAQCEQQARSQGLTLQTTPLDGGGFHVRAVAAAMPSAPPPGYGANPYAPQAQNPYAPSAPPPPAPAPYGNPYGAPPGAYAAPPAMMNPYGAPAPRFNPGAAAVAYNAAGGGYCDCCGVSGPTRHSTFMQNIGMLVIRFPATRSGSMCKRCINQYFWQYTLVTSFFGWWGMISFIYSLISIPTNIVNYVRTIGMPEPAPEAYARAGIPYSAWPGWRIAVLLLGIGGALVSLLWTVAAVAAIVDAANDNDLDGGGLIGFILFTLVTWIVPALMITAAAKKGKVAQAT